MCYERLVFRFIFRSVKFYLENMLNGCFRLKILKWIFFNVEISENAVPFVAEIFWKFKPEISSNGNCRDYRFNMLCNMPC